MIEMTGKRFTTKEEVLNQLNKLYEESQDLITKKEDVEYELLHLKEKYEELLEENEQLKQELFEAKKDYLIETSDVVDRALYVEDEIKELRINIFEKGIYDD